MDGSQLLAGLPAALRDELLVRYREIARNYLEHRWEPAELNGGKFAEAAYSIVAGAVAGVFPAVASKPSNFVAACRALEMTAPNAKLVGDRSMRVLIPRQLVGLYEIRNNRGVGHIGGDVDANSIDAANVFSTASWVLAELVRIFHGVSISKAQAAVDALSERTIPIVWMVPGSSIKRVLDSKISARDQTLVLLHLRQGWVLEKDLFESIEYGRIDNYRNNVLRPLHGARFAEFDPTRKQAHITPLGSRHVELTLLSGRIL